MTRSPGSPSSVPAGAGQATARTVTGTALVRVPDFTNTASAFRHYAKHGRGAELGKKGKATAKAGGADVPEFRSFSEYRSAARAFHSGPASDGVLQGFRANGDIVRFDPATGYFGVRTQKGTIKTFFRPSGDENDRLKYFYQQFQ